MRIINLVIMVAALFIGLSFANNDARIEKSFDALSNLNIGIDLPSPTLTGKATSIFEAQANTPCSETDDGNNPYVQGVATSEGQQYPDRCDADVLVEYYCDGAKMHSYSKPCIYGCVNGVCKNTPAQQEKPVSQTVDEDDIAIVRDALEPRWAAPTAPVTCKNGFRDGDETDADCGGLCNPCTYSKMCKIDADCNNGAVCNYRIKRCLNTKY